MKYFIRILTVYLAISLLSMCFAFPQRIFAQSLTDTEKRIAELTQKINELQSTENTLSKQINILNSEITLAGLKIESIKSAITKLSSEADQLATEITRIETLLTKRSELVLRRIPEAYKRSVLPQFGMIFFSSNFGDFISRVKYVSTVQAEDAQLLLQLKATQNNFSERKQLREQKKVEQVQLQKQLEAENIRMEAQKNEKQALLAQTKNSESVYQQLLSQALAEKRALDNALVSGVSIGPVKKGDPIALVGNTGYPGCSTGAHLHFEVHKNNSWTDPSQYLSNKTVSDDQNGGTWTVGSGNWDWPLADTVRITQHYGKTPYSWRYAYSGGIHTGFDMVSTGSDVIRAPKDGTLYSSSQACGSASVIKIKYIDHGDGVISFYLHVQ
jgi:peptidoglycan hydrolase CwlO-like protein